MMHAESLFVTSFPSRSLPMLPWCFASVCFFYLLLLLALVACDTWFFSLSLLPSVCLFWAWQCWCCCTLWWKYSEGAVGFDLAWIFETVGLMLEAIGLYHFWFFERLDTGFRLKAGFWCLFEFGYGFRSYKLQACWFEITGFLGLTGCWGFLAFRQCKFETWLLFVLIQVYELG